MTLQDFKKVDKNRHCMAESDKHNRKRNNVMLHKWPNMLFLSQEIKHKRYNEIPATPSSFISCNLPIIVLPDTKFSNTKYACVIALNVLVQTLDM